MKEIDRRGRALFRGIMWSLFGTLDLLLLIGMFTSSPETQPESLYIIIPIITAGILCIMFFVYRYAPRVYLSEKGIYMKPFFRKRFYPWSDIQQALILERNNNKGTWYEFYMVTVKGSPWVTGDIAQTFTGRNNHKNLLKIPLTDESREYVKTYHGKLVFDESKGKTIYYTFLK